MSLLSIHISTDEIIQALNWTLIHSLWQGMILSVVAGSIVFFTKRSSPLLRYNLLTAAVLVFVIAVASTFSIQIINTKQVAEVMQPMPAAETITIEPAIQSLALESELSITSKAVAFFNANAYWIVLTWLLIIGLQFIRLTAGLYGVYQLKRRQVFSAGEYWNNRITELSQQLKINKRVQLLQSGIANMPAVIGYFKPVVLFPAGMLALLPPDEVDAILMHELAHIRRQDFLVNVLQNLIEIIFFFNPAVLWVSSLIKSERENCCDDIAVGQTDSKQSYIKALLAFQAFNLPLVSPLTNAFSGDKNHLMNRIKRIIYNNNKTLNNMEKKFLAAGMIITGACIFAFSSNYAQQNATEKRTVLQQVPAPLMEQKIEALPVYTDTIPATQSNSDNGKISTTLNGKKYTMITEDNQVSELYVNGKKIPAEKIKDYKNVTNKILRETKLDKEQSEKELAESAFEIEQSKKELEESKAEIAQSKIEMEQAKKEMEEDKEQAKKDIEQSKLDIEQSKIEITQAKKEMDQAQKEMQRDMKQTKIEIEQSQKQMMQAKKEMEQSRKQMQQSKMDMEQSQLLQEKIIGDFIREDIIKDKKELSSFKLNSEVLIVNGVKQPDVIYKRFKDKYVKGKNWAMMFSNIDEIK